MAYEFKGKVKARDEEVRPKAKIDWAALFYWLLSILISAIPVYAYILLWLNDDANKGKTKWDLAFDCIAKQDVLWIFSTVLLFALMNWLLDYLSKKTGKKAKFPKFFIGLGFLDFVVLECTWGLFKYSIVNQGQHWTVWLGVVLIAIAMICATRLQMDAVKSEA